ncbi:peroxiredoxin-like family protein [Marivirga arenosa]|uniref:thioredoxin-dependent peroxiredoxin n=1 Tax=Marivirga arenosa TaxID=3059076 RepID=A0AA49GG40_9BACT|nr:peroxiredoxin-like family protein [Marivirga sp. ABR2-2]WKK86248.2 peroxiredoxin-like family protein [Marivirga sp. ABR2-2]
MTLQERLDKIKVKIESSLPQETVAIMHQGNADLEATGISNNVLKVGDLAPTFNLKNQNDELVSSKELLKSGSIVLTFYRGVWCPYCNTDIANLNQYTDEMNGLNATMLGISPQLPIYNQKIISQEHLNFDLLTDNHNSIAEAFGLRWEMKGALKSVYKDKFKINLADYNGDDSWTLPVPVRFIIGADGLIKYAEHSVDYTKRPDPTQLIHALKNK